MTCSPKLRQLGVESFLFVAQGVKNGKGRAERPQESGAAWRLRPNPKPSYLTEGL